jgi:hypothetical protein
MDTSQVGAHGAGLDRRFRSHENDRIHTHRFHPYKFFFLAEIEFIDTLNPSGFTLGL